MATSTSWCRSVGALNSTSLDYSLNRLAGVIEVARLRGAGRYGEAGGKSHFSIGPTRAAQALSLCVAPSNSA